MERESNYRVNIEGLWKRFYTGRQLLYVIILFIISCVGTVDSFLDIYGDRMLGMLPFSIVGVLAIIQVTSILWEKKYKLPDILGRFLFGSLLGSIPLIVASVTFTFLTWLVIGEQTHMTDPNANHYYGSDSIAMHLILIMLVAYIVQVLGGLITFLIVVLPIVAVRIPEEVVKGSNFEGMENKEERTKAMQSAYFGIAIFIIGSMMSEFTLGFKDRVFHPDEMWLQFKWVLAEMKYGIYDTTQLIWLIGIIGSVVGIGLCLVALLKKTITDSLQRREEEW